MLKHNLRVLLVTTVRAGLIAKAPFKVDPKKELSAPLKVTDDKLTLDFSKAVKNFCFPLEDVDLAWDELQFIKTK